MRDNVAVIRERLADPVELARRLDLLRGARVVRDSVRIICPWHGEKNPSCSVSRGPDQTARVRCFSCGATGDALSLVAVCRGLDPRLDFGAVLRAAAEIAGVDLEDDSRVMSRPRPRTPRMWTPERFEARIKAEIDAAADAWLRGRPVRYSPQVRRALEARDWLLGWRRREERC